MNDFDIYPVGLLHDLRYARSAGDWGPLRYGLSYLSRRLMERNWRAARNYFNGYLAEPVSLPESSWHRAGSGWTQDRAIRSFWRHNPEAIR